MYFRYFITISPWRRVWPFIWTNMNPLHPGILCAMFGWNWPSGSGEEDENVKSLQTERQTDGQTDGQMDGRTDDGQQVIRKAHLSFQLRWAKKGSKCCQRISSLSLFKQVGKTRDLLQQTILKIFKSVPFYYYLPLERAVAFK